MSGNCDAMKSDGDVNPINTDCKIGQDNIVLNLGPFWLDIHNRVFAISALAVIGSVVLTLMFLAQAEPLFGSIRGWLTSNPDWFFVSVGNIFVVVCIALAISPLDKERC
jgi:betaine/carnitine transporter, BCCT family